MARKENTPDIEEADYEDFEDQSPKKKIVVYGEYDRYRGSTLKKKRIRISLLDLMIGLVILAILGFIGYQSLQGYGAQSRDDIRAGHLALIKEGLDKLVKQGKSLPDPFEKKEILANSTVIGVQGFAGEALFAAIGKKVLRDPLDNSYYTYYMLPGSKQYEVMAFLESQSDDTVTSLDKQKQSILQRLQAWVFPQADYQNRVPYSIGSLGNILLSNVGEAKNTPLNLIIKGDNIDLSNIQKYDDMFYLGANCKDILTRFPENLGNNGNQLILLGDKVSKVYCDMTTDGGGWTLFYANNGHANSPLKESYVQMREKMTQGGYDLSNYDDTNLAGLLDYNHFINNGAKEVLATNRVGGGGKWVKFTFDTSASLSWALGKDVLGKTESGCLTIPNNGNWTIVNNDKKINYIKLGKIMNAQGNSWGVSHVEFACNYQTKSIQPHISFYRANGNQNEHRTRSTEGIGGNGTQNEYRYFIR